jgi:hypothetical protein
MILMPLQKTELLFRLSPLNKWKFKKELTIPDLLAKLKIEFTTIKAIRSYLTLVDADARYTIRGVVYIIKGIVCALYQITTPKSHM